MREWNKRKIGTMIGIAASPLVASAVIAPVTAWAINLQSNAITKVALSTIFSNDQAIGTFTHVPNDEALLAQAKVTQTNFHNESTEWYTISTAALVSGNTWRITLTAGADCPYYTGNVNLTYVLNPTTGTHDLKSFFNNVSNNYNLTTNISAGNTAYYPTTTGDIPTNPLSLLNSMHDSSSNSINLNQLTVTSAPAFNSTSDYYEFTVAPVQNSYFYDNTTTSYTISFAVARTLVSHTNITNYTNNDYSYRPTGGYDADALWYTLGYNNTPNPVIASLEADSNLSWTGLDSNTPNFTVAGNSTYTTKTYTLTSNVYVEANSPYELSVPTKTLTDLSAKITGKDTTNNDFLKFPNSLPTIDDIRWAITQGGNNGSTFSDAEILQWADIVISNIADGGNGTGTATISAKPDADNYHNLNYDQTKTVTISFTYPN